MAVAQGALSSQPASQPASQRALQVLCVAPSVPAVPIFDGQLSAIAAEMEGKDPEECQIQVGAGTGS